MIHVGEDGAQEPNEGARRAEDDTGDGRPDRAAPRPAGSHGGAEVLQVGAVGDHDAGGPPWLEVSYLGIQTPGVGGW